MKNRKMFWLSFALINLSVVALLGVTLRSKILFPLQGLDFKHVLHAHSHFAFGGWITLALMTLMTYDLLPEGKREKKIYQWIFWGILLNAIGMLVSFLCQGYAFFSILFSTLFIFATYTFSLVFIKDIWYAKVNASIKILSISSLIYLSFSSAGPFTLAYLMASHSNNILLYRDAIYTYLHLQYNGFFTLAVFALFFNNLIRNLNSGQRKKVSRLAITLSASVIPTLFISYLWHYPIMGIQVLAMIGSFTIILTLTLLISVLHAVKHNVKGYSQFVKTLGLVSIIAFMLKSILQTGTMIPALGKWVYGDRAIIIGYLHLVLLGFITLYLLAHLLHSGVLNATCKFTRRAIIIFASAILANETILMMQGLGNMLMISNSIYSWLLWIISLWLFTGALLIVISRLRYAYNQQGIRSIESQINQDFILNQ